VRVVILGAGPTGLGAAHRLAELGHDDWDVYERAASVGGLAGSVRDEHGFTWDHGGHVMFSHYDYVDDLVARMLGDDREVHARRAFVLLHDRLVPFPLQHNIHRLPDDVFAECRAGIAEAQADDLPRRNFAEWIHAVFGSGLARHFMIPYNTKVWAHPLDLLGTEWQGERVPEVDLARIDENRRLDVDDSGWGPNATFTFPTRGTGLLPQRIAEALPRPVHLGREAVAIDQRRRVVTFNDGSTSSYDRLVSTMPLPDLVDRLDDPGDELRAAASALHHTSGIFVGIGLRGEAPPERCWVYFPAPDVPFYRVTYLSNYSPAMTPGAGHWSLLAEISASAYRPADPAAAADATVAGLVATGLLTADQAEYDIVSRHVTSVPYSYPAPTLGRDAALATLHGALEPLGIHSRGRFGSWRYEIGNTDHSLMLGVELADRLVGGGTEPTWHS
jgi:protoporphyrinogen oxidase